MVQLRKVLLAVASVLSVSASPAFGAIASITVDWSQLRFEVQAVLGLPVPTLTFTDRRTHVNASATTPGEGFEVVDHVLTDWTGSKTGTAATVSAVANVAVGASQLAVSAAATFPPFCCDPAFANSSLERTGTFSLSGPGAIVFTVPYSASGQGPLFDPSNMFTANLSGNVGFAADQGGFVNGSKSFVWDSFGTGDFSANGLLLFGLVADGPGSGFFNVQLSTLANASGFGGAIPEPAVVLQFATGLAMGLIVFLRRRYAAV